MKDINSQKTAYVLSVNSMISCLVENCANNILGACNLKGISVDTSGRCEGIVKPRTAKKNTKV
jgi:hypothetical protein